MNNISICTNEKDLILLKNKMLENVNTNLFSFLEEKLLFTLKNFRFEIKNKFLRKGIILFKNDEINIYDLINIDLLNGKPTKWSLIPKVEFDKYKVDLNKLNSEVLNKFNEMNIKTIIHSGTLVGYARERRPLLWDDDFDYYVLNSEIIKHLDNFKEYFKSIGCEFISPINNNKPVLQMVYQVIRESNTFSYNYSHKKIRGIKIPNFAFIDLMPLFKVRMKNDVVDVKFYKKCSTENNWIVGNRKNFLFYPRYAYMMAQSMNLYEHFKIVLSILFRISFVKFKNKISNYSNVMMDESIDNDTGWYKRRDLWYRRGDEINIFNIKKIEFSNTETYVNVNYKQELDSYFKDWREKRIMKTYSMHPIFWLSKYKFHLHNRIFRINKNSKIIKIDLIK